MASLFLRVISIESKNFTDKNEPTTKNGRLFYFLFVVNYDFSKMDNINLVIRGMLL